VPAVTEKEGSTLMIAHIVGIDPGLVDTGCVSLVFRPNLRSISVEHGVIAGTNAQAVKDWVFHPSKPATKHIFIEAYRPRMKLDSDKRMVEMEQELRKVLPDAKVLPNMGIKRVIPQSLMEVFGVWSWPTVTHHQDLRSAARIALLGMVKEPRLNAIMADVVRDHLEGRPWNVAHG
jgi:hypothetical protein